MIRVFDWLIERWRRIRARMMPDDNIDRFFTTAEKGFDQIDFVAVGIACVGQSRNHVGLLHKQNVSPEVQFLHLAWHQDLRNHTPDMKYRWAAPNIPSPRLRQVAARCRQIFRANPEGIPYAFSSASDCFDVESNKFLLGPTRHGLTCATFVVAVFNSAGIEILSTKSWPTDLAEDRVWQSHVIAELENSSPPASPEHIRAVRSEVGGIRIRPEHVAAAVTVSPQPAEYLVTNRIAQRIREKLSQ